MADQHVEPTAESDGQAASPRSDRALLAAGLVIVLILLVCVLMFLIAS